MTAHMRDGASVHEHDIHMIQLIEYLVGLEWVIPKVFSTDIILLSLHSSFDGFEVKFNVN